DAAGSIAMGATAGKVVLTNATAALTGSCPSGITIVDLVGYGTTANCFEDGAAAPAPSNTNADLRADSGCADTDRNGIDFAVGAPTPRNTASPFHFCTGDNAPAVSATSPLAGATDVGFNTTITITFSEPVNVPSAWYTISCATSGSHTAAQSGSPTTYTLDP